ncbi:MAG TPA: hypothetical protein H9698_10570 [Candidatus Ruthenibacterium merdavium]|uniref:Uncharacterized protein n=1 Tax=Candidatus Ruthenibacterium merdavium TaxID=2838752 RepID=A0A9D2Q860_9FIRM|nr:hypothetical protein [Candidatus Ruthenibacterium merdavium]
MKSKTYEEFVEKFKSKRTTDDCMTPPLIYDAVLSWVVKEYNISPDDVIRPFWPGKDYQKEEYPEGCIVVDNPPFSILSSICEWYLERNIKFFLFAPGLTLFSKKNYTMINHIGCNAQITYENGATVRTGFLTNMGDGDIVAQTSPTLLTAIKEASANFKKQSSKKLPKYQYPFNILTSAMLNKYSEQGITFNVRRSECVRVSSLDGQRAEGRNNGIFGGGLLLSESAAFRHHEAAEAAEAAKAAKAAKAEKVEKIITFELSAKEKEIVRLLK